MRLTTTRVAVKFLALAGAATLALAGCSGGDSDSNGDSAASTEGPWSYTTGYGNTITTDEFPNTIVTDLYATVALWDYGIRPDGVFGWGFDVSAGDVDISGIPVVGRDAEFSLEKLLNIAPQVVIGYGNSEDPSSWTWWEPEFAEQVNEVAPFVGVNFGDNTTDGLLAEFDQLAVALGGDNGTAAIAEAKEDYEAAKERVRQAAAANPDISVLPANGIDPLYLADGGLQQVAQLRDLGVDVVVPPGHTEDEGWIEYSWENFPQVPADVILVYDPSNIDYDSIPLFASSAAAQAQQTLPWDDKRPNTYRSYADWLNSVAEAIENADDVA